MSLEGSILWYRDAIFVTSAHRELPRNQNIFIWWPAASCARGIRIVGLASALSSRIVVAPARETTLSAAPNDCAISLLLTNGTTVSYHFHNLQLRLSL